MRREGHGYLKIILIPSIAAVFGSTICILLTEKLQQCIIIFLHKQDIHYQLALHAMLLSFYC